MQNEFSGKLNPLTLKIFALKPAPLISFHPAIQNRSVSAASQLARKYVYAFTQPLSRERELHNSIGIDFFSMLAKGALAVCYPFARVLVFCCG
jgi:hypothetical protein